MENQQQTTTDGGFVTLAVLAAAAGASAALLFAPAAGSRTRKRFRQGLESIGGEAAGTIAQLRREVRKRKRESQREKQLIALAGFIVGAGITALLTPEPGAVTRERLGSTLGRIKVGAVDRIERLRRTAPDEPSESPVRSVEELGQEPNDVF